MMQYKDTCTWLWDIAHDLHLLQDVRLQDALSYGTLRYRTPAYHPRTHGGGTTEPSLSNHNLKKSSCLKRLNAVRTSGKNIFQLFSNFFFFSPTFPLRRWEICGTIQPKRKNHRLYGDEVPVGLVTLLAERPAAREVSIGGTQRVQTTAMEIRQSAWRSCA